jgi:hypothetical protein
VDGFLIIGGSVGGHLGTSVTGAGDVNGDGFADILVGVPDATIGTLSTAGHVYLLFGHSSATPFADFDGFFSPSISVGLKIIGHNTNGRLGAAVSRAGDLNNDGLDDILLGSSGYAEDMILSSGAVFVVYGRRDMSPLAGLTLANITASSGLGCKILGPASIGAFGGALSAAGDINGDGLPDFIVGSPSAIVRITRPGAAYVFFGRGYALADIDLRESGLASEHGFMILGSPASSISHVSKFGYAVAGAGDFDGDGVSDVLVTCSTDTRRQLHQLSMLTAPARTTQIWTSELCRRVLSASHS